jgi:hypothetical protein
VLVLPKPGSGPLCCWLDFGLDALRRRRAARSFMILTLAVLIRSFHRFCTVRLCPRNRVLLAM